MLVAVAAPAAIVLGGCVQTATVAGVSDSCTQPSTLNDGFFLNRSVFFRVSTQADPTNPRTTWLCYRIKAPNQPETAGRIDVNPTTDATGPDVTTDVSSRGCDLGANFWPHPIQDDTVLGTPLYLDAFLGTANFVSTAALCVEVGSFKQRVLVHGPVVDDADVTVNTDPAPPAAQDTTPPPAGQPSSSCAQGAYGTPSELINAHTAGRDLFLYTAQPASNEAHICARVSGGPSGGGHLSVKAATNQIVDIRQSADTTPCTQDIVTSANPPFSIRTSPTGQTPPSVCVNGTRYTVVTGPVPPVVSFTPDTT